MSDKPKNKCQEKMYSNWSWYDCNKTAKMTHEGKHYCGIHDPVKRKAKREEKSKQWREEWDRKAREDAEERRMDELKTAALEAIYKIAAGHNDAMSLAREILEKHK